MADGIYVSMCGAASRTEQLDAIADNLANAQTPGFKASRPGFEAFLAASGAQDKTYPATVATGFDLRVGPTEHTGNPLDVLPDDGAFLAVRTPGGIAYTRDGRLGLDAQRRLVQNGRPVLDPNGREIHVPPGAAPQIGSDGILHVGPAQVGQLGLFKLDGAVDRLGPTLLAPGEGGAARPLANGTVRTGELEMANANPLDGMVQLIAAQRHFDASMQAIQTYRALDQHGSEIARIR